MTNMHERYSHLPSSWRDGLVFLSFTDKSIYKIMLFLLKRVYPKFGPVAQFSDRYFFDKVPFGHIEPMKKIIERACVMSITYELCIDIRVDEFFNALNGRMNDIFLYDRPKDDNRVYVSSIRPSNELVGWDSIFNIKVTKGSFVEKNRINFPTRRDSFEFLSFLEHYVDYLGSSLGVVKMDGTVVD